FQGVVNVVARLFDIVQPSHAFFGQKDFQQVAVIKSMTRQLNYKVEIVVVETARSASGLALSSRNQRLNEQERKAAAILSETLLKGKECAKVFAPKETKEMMMTHFEKGSLQLEYIEIVDPDSLLPLNNIWKKGATACIAAFCGDVRLIDNLELIPSN